MRLTLLLVVLLVTVALTSAGRKNGKKKMNKSLKWFHKKCGENSTVSYSACTAEGKMTRTYASPSNDMKCNKEEEMDCVITKTGGRGGCSKEITFNYTACGQGEEMYTMSMSMTGCAKGDKTFSKQLPCDGKPRMSDKKAARKAAKAAKKAKKQMFKAYIAKKKELKAKGCFYQKIFECDVTGTFSMRPVDETRSKQPADCDPILKAPCMPKKTGGKRKNKKIKNMKRKRKNGGKNRKN